MTVAGKSFLQVEDEGIFKIRTHADGPSGKLPLSEEMLRNWPSGDLFGLSQNAGMGWSPKEIHGKSMGIQGPPPDATNPGLKPRESLMGATH